jgi:ribosomal protein S21
MQVFVRDNNVEQALRILKKKMQREGVFREMKRARFYEKPYALIVCADQLRPHSRPSRSSSSILESRW